MSTATEAGPVPAPDGREQVAELLAACRVPARYAGPAVARLGASAAQQLREDPWLLLSLPQIRPDQADWFARQVLHEAAEPQDSRRGRALVSYLLARAARDGHTAVPARVIAGALGRLRIADPAAAISAAVDTGAVLPFDAAGEPAGAPADGDPDGTRDDDPGGDSVVLALARYAMAEEAVAEGLHRLAALAEPLGPLTAEQSPDSARPDATELDAAQQAAVHAVAGHGVTVLASGPGTGTGRTLAAVLAMAAGHGLRVALAAPSGPAARRLAQRAGAPATTVHRLLGAQQPGPAGGQPDQHAAFRRDENSPLDADLVVVDEAALLDAELAAALVEACADGSRLLLAGDPAQLPSAGPGRVLADIIDSAVVPVTELTRLHRPQPGGAIVRLAAAVRAGTLPRIDPAGREVVVVGAAHSGEASHRVLQLVTDSIPRALGISAADIQVITPVRDGPAGTTELNRVLKRRLNPGPGRHGGFDPGDRVTCVADHRDDGLAQGELGTVTGPEDGGLLVAFPDGPVCVPQRLLGALRPGWALTPRRAQGAQWPAVVAVFPAEAAGMLSRPLVYTALTRAQRHLSVVHGTGPALASAVATVGEQPRVTRLAALLAEAG